ADRMLALLRHRRVVDHQHRIAATDEPVCLNEQLGLQWRCIPDANRNKMVQLIIIARRKTLRHWLNALAVTWPDQPRHIKRAHPLPRLVTQPFQERLEPTAKLIFPIRPRVLHSRPSTSRPPMNHRKTDSGIPVVKKTAKVVLEHDPEKWEPVFGKRSCS